MCQVAAKVSVEEDAQLALQRELEEAREDNDLSLKGFLNLLKILSICFDLKFFHVFEVFCFI